LKQEEKARAIIAAVLDEASDAQREAVHQVPNEDIRLACAAYQLGLDVGTERVLQHIGEEMTALNPEPRKNGIGYEVTTIVVFLIVALIGWIILWFWNA